MDKKEGINVPTFLKWAGGKRQILDQLSLLLPKKITRYFEPFIGGGAMFFDIKQRFKPRFSLVSDINPDLINAYHFIKDDVDKLIESLKEIKKTNHSKEAFYEKRKEYNSTHDRLKKAALLIYLNKTCFNGLFRVNSKGEFNVPFGRYKNPAILQESRLRLASHLLQDTDIRLFDFDNILPLVEGGDFIYLDPPYFPLNGTSNFTSYQIGAFGTEQQRRLATLFRQLDKKGCNIMLSNSNTPLIRDLYKGYTFVTIKAKRMINCKGSRRGEIDEYVITNY